MQCIVGHCISSINIFGLFTSFLWRNIQTKNHAYCTRKSKFGKVMLAEVQYKLYYKVVTVTVVTDKKSTSTIQITLHCIVTNTICPHVTSHWSNLQYAPHIVQYSHRTICTLYNMYLTLIQSTICTSHCTICTSYNMHIVQYAPHIDPIYNMHWNGKCRNSTNILKYMLK